MSLTKEELEERCRLACPHCRAGSEVLFRKDTKEWVHDKVATNLGLQKGHTICWAHDIRVQNG